MMKAHCAKSAKRPGREGTRENFDLGNKFKIAKNVAETETSKTKSQFRPQ